jgi:ATP-binding cassette subfamily B protein
VKIDGHDVRAYSRDSLRAQMAVVFQDNFLFDLSIRDNIRLGNLAATDADVEAAAKAAEIHRFIQALPDGYDTMVGERGVRLSGGQRQRIAMARALVRNPAILILDEAASALDQATEAAIHETLKKVSQGRTVISVTHRLTSIVDSDIIYVLNHGRLVEQGTHHTLLQRHGLYSKLWRSQGDTKAAVSA